MRNSLICYFVFTTYMRYSRNYTEVSYIALITEDSICSSLDVNELIKYSTVPYQKYSYPTKYPCSDCAIYRLNIQVETKSYVLH